MVEGSKKPPDTDFYQQRLKAWQPILTPKWVVATFLIIGVVFIPIGFVLKGASDSVVEKIVQYGGDGAQDEGNSACMLGNPGSHRTCTVSFEAPDDMDAPIYVYYQLEDFYQNHRNYVKSRDDNQLKGEIVSRGSLDDCEPLINSPTDPNKVLHPCGLIANSFFNDTFELLGGMNMDETGIAWQSDIDEKFKRVSDSVQAQYASSVQFIHETYPTIPASKGVEDEHFIVWMRTAALPTFRKLYGKIETDIGKGDTVSFNVTSRFNVKDFKGKKYLVVSTTSWLGGKNSFLGWAYIIVGIVCVVLALVFGVKEWSTGRDLGDPQFLTWNN